MTRTTANVLCMRGQRHWPAGALLWQCRKAAKKADARKLNNAKRKTLWLPAFK